jgi:hypothetical protein
VSDAIHDLVMTLARPRGEGALCGFLRRCLSIGVPAPLKFPQGVAVEITGLRRPQDVTEEAGPGRHRHGTPQIWSLAQQAVATMQVAQFLYTTAPVGWGTIPLVEPSFPPG